MTELSTSSSSRVAVVTGGARGIGLAIGRWFLARGYSVALLDIDGTTLDQAVAELAQPAKLLGLHCDVSKLSQVDSAAKAVVERDRKSVV